MIRKVDDSLLENLRLPRALKDTEDNTITIEQLARAKGQQKRAYIDIIPHQSETISN
jgi:low affinity Fe/Cu permease